MRIMCAVQLKNKNGAKYFVLMLDFNVTMN